jgi:hypothetical protein
MDVEAIVAAAFDSPTLPDNPPLTTLAVEPKVPVAPPPDTLPTDILIIEDKKPEKKRPGRPRKQLPEHDIPINGVVAKPSNDNNVMEFVYSNPPLFKRLFGCFKLNSVIEINMVYDTNQLVMCMPDHLGKSIICAKIFCDKIPHYYCKRKVELGVNREHIETFFHSMNNAYFRVTFFVREEYSKSVLNISLKNCNIGNRDNHEIELIDISEKCDPIPDNIDDNYPIKFTFPAKFFKKTITDISQRSKILTIEKNGLEPLCLKYSTDRKVASCSSYNEPDKINLQSTIVDGKIFSVSVKLEYILAFAKSALGDFITISADYTNPIIFRSVLDNGVCVVTMKTETVKNDGPH